MKYGAINAAILGSALVISIVIVGGRLSYASRHPRIKEVTVAPAPFAGKKSTEGDHPSPSPEQAAIAEIQELLTSALKLSGSSIGVEGRELELREAKKSLERARDLLETLPQDNEDVKKLRLRQQELYHNVVKDSGFDG